MALSLLNHFVWQIPDDSAHQIFMAVDALVLFTTYYAEKGMKAERVLRRIEAAAAAETTSGKNGKGAAGDGAGAAKVKMI
eukprot:CAMPEP_0194314938 /NCGR_PEP_ID=MMETSP0171-20130528/11739_1 /TAXON_ID=218684 /ORGANISM="Corethron pennatum, Strain L29A3" /LENGTH=79 /DNA_ID=CAMNT_0039070545 /DNA_START=20 /DNA_END=259 /DNA_ORIENTATION=-